VAKLTLKNICLSLFIVGIISSCNQETRDPNKDLTLPDFAFVGLTEPLADKENVKVTVHVKIPYTELQFTRFGDKYLARYEVGVDISDEKKERIAGLIWSDSLLLGSYQDTRKTENTILTAKHFQVPAGELRIAVRVTDLYTKKTRILTDKVDHSEMYAGPISLGNIMIMNNAPTASRELLMDEAFYEIMDTLRFKARIIGDKAPYKIWYELKVLDESKLKETILLNNRGAIDSLLSFVVPLSNMHYSNYSLFLYAEDGNANKVVTKANFRVRIKGINFDVGDLDEAVKQLAYIADESDIQAILAESGDAELKKFTEFWTNLDPTPGTPENELMEEYYRRVAFSIEAFTVMQDGWRTDRGMIYILFGPPDEIHRGSFEIDQKPYQIWDYYRVGKQFVFRDETGFGNYRLDPMYLNNSDWRFRY
jgi:GWxTD domain-containing protein